MTCVCCVFAIKYFTELESHHLYMCIFCTCKSSCGILAESSQQHGKHFECRLQPWKGLSSLDAHPTTIRDPEALEISLVQVDFNAAVLIHLSSTLTSHKLYLFPLQRNETS